MRLGNSHRELEVTILFITCLSLFATLSLDVLKTRPSSIHPDRWVIAFLSCSIWSFFFFSFFEHLHCWGVHIKNKIQMLQNWFFHPIQEALLQSWFNYRCLDILRWIPREQLFHSTALAKRILSFLLFSPLSILTNSQQCVACKWSVIKGTLKCQVLGKGQERVFRQEPGATSWPQMARPSLLLDFQGQLASMLLPRQPHGNPGMFNRYVCRYMLSTCVWESLQNGL